MVGGCLQIQLRSDQKITVTHTSWDAKMNLIKVVFGHLWAFCGLLPLNLFRHVDPDISWYFQISPKFGGTLAQDLEFFAPAIAANLQGDPGFKQNHFITPADQRTARLPRWALKWLLWLLAFQVLPAILLAGLSRFRTRSRVRRIWSLLKGRKLHKEQKSREWHTNLLFSGCVCMCMCVCVCVWACFRILYLQDVHSMGQTVCLQAKCWWAGCRNRERGYPEARNASGRMFRQHYINKLRVINECCCCD